MNFNIPYFNRLRENRQRYLNHLNFLVECRKKHLIPRFIKLKCNLTTSPRLRKTMRRVHKIVLRAVIKDTRSKLAYVESKLYNLHLMLSKHLQPIVWTDVDHNSYHEVQINANKHRAIHRKKIRDLLNDNTNNAEPVPTLSMEQQALLDNPKVINISNIDIPPAHIKTLNLGLDFSIKTTNVDNLQIVANVEKSFQHSKISTAQKDFLRHKISQILVENVRTSKNNLTKTERLNINSLQANKDIVITPADKGNTIVILSSGQYQQGIEDLLATDVYSPCNKSGLDNLLGEVKKVIYNSPVIDKAKKRALIPTYYQPGRLYISPKVHKPILAYRPIISSINTPTYLLAKHMALQLSHISKLNPYSISNNKEFLNSLNQHNSDNYLMVSFDVKSMFTCIPVTAALEAFSNRLTTLNYNDTDNQAIMKLLEVCTRPPIFSINNKLFQQDQGLPMGGSLSPLLCDVYMWNLENNLQSLPFQPVLWKRYVDDVFSLLDTTKDNVPHLLRHLNQLDSYVQFTAEIEQDKVLSFLDIAITRSQNKFVTTVYRKPFAVALPPHQRSAHPNSQKMSAFSFYIRRAFTVCSTSNLLQDEINFIKHIAIDRGYTAHVIDNMVKKFKASLIHPSRESTLSDISAESESQKPSLILPQSSANVTRIATICRKKFRAIYKPDIKMSTYLHAPKDTPKSRDRPGVYCIPCECGMAYVGQTSRALRFRISEHKTNIKHCKTTTSNIAQHAWDNSHRFHFQNTSIIKQTSDRHVLNTYEAAHILNNSQRLVNDEHYPPLSSIWNRIVYQIEPLKIQELT